jgi:hypothetical protein
MEQKYNIKAVLSLYFKIECIIFWSALNVSFYLFFFRVRRLTNGNVDACYLVTCWQVIMLR